MTMSLNSSRGPTGKNIGNRMTGGGDVVPKGFNVGQLQQFTPEQMQLFKSLFSQASPEGFLSKLAGGDQGTFEQLEAPAMRQFQGLQGHLASRFSGMGLGGRRSSGFQQASNQAASDFAQELQAQRLGLQRQALQDLMGISGQLLSQRPYEKFLSEKPKPFWQELLGGSAPGIASGIGQGGTLAILKKLGLLGV